MLEKIDQLQNTELPECGEIELIGPGSRLRFSSACRCGAASFEG